MVEIIKESSTSPCLVFGFILKKSLTLGCVFFLNISVLCCRKKDSCIYQELIHICESVAAVVIRYCLIDFSSKTLALFNTINNQNGAPTIREKIKNILLHSEFSKVKTNLLIGIKSINNILNF